MLFTLLAVLAGCGSFFSSCHDCVAATPFLYSTAPNDISSLSVNTAGVPKSIQNQSGPSSSLGIVVDPTGKFLYVSDFANGNVEAFTINPAGGLLTPVSGFPFSIASASGGLALDPSTKFLYVTLMNASAVAAFSRSLR